MSGLWDCYLYTAADVNEADPITTQTPLFLAAEGFPDAVKWLLDHGAKVNILSDAYFGLPATPMLTAIEWHATECFGETDRIEGTLQTKTRKGLRIIEMLIDYGADLNLFGVDCVTPLMAAVFSPNTDALRLLLKSGADPNLHVSSDNEETCVLITALKSANLEATKVLILNGAQFDMFVNYNISATERAIMSVIRYVLQFDEDHLNRLHIAWLLLLLGSPFEQPTIKFIQTIHAHATKNLFTSVKRNGGTIESDVSEFIQRLEENASHLDGVNREPIDQHMDDAEPLDALYFVEDCCGYDESFGSGDERTEWGRRKRETEARPVSHFTRWTPNGAEMNMLEALQNYVTQPKTLLQRCRLYLHKRLCLAEIQQLPIPQPLQDFICCFDVLK